VEGVGLLPTSSSNLHIITTPPANPVTVALLWSRHGAPIRESGDGTELVGKNSEDHIFGNDYVFQATSPRDPGFTDAIRGIAEGEGNGIFGSSGQARAYAGVLGRIKSANGAGVKGENDQGPAGYGYPPQQIPPLGASACAARGRIPTGCASSEPRAAGGDPAS
jgi:hypothetical protein